MRELAEALRRRYAGRAPGLLGAERACAVLCPLVETPEGPSLLYEVRAASLRQGGEVCFPGGWMEAGEGPVQCALRETWEELSIPGVYPSAGAGIGKRSGPRRPESLPGGGGGDLHGAPFLFPGYAAYGVPLRSGTTGSRGLPL